MVCQNCGAKCKEILDLGKQPICNRNLKTFKEFKNEKRYPLKVVFCPSCYLVQLSRQLPTSLLFSKNFNYVSTSSKEVISHYKTIALRYLVDFNLSNNEYVVDIGSNDGVFLQPLKDNGVRVIGVDPATIPAEMANKKGIFTINKDFASAEKYVKEITNGKIRLITAFDVIAHTGDIGHFLEKVKDLLKANPQAIFISQSHYLPRLVSNCEFDTIYHEHQRYYTVTSMQNLFKRHHLYIYHCEENDFYGGSIITYASYEPQTPSEAFLKKIKSERKFTKFVTYKKFGKQVDNARSRLLKLLRKEKRAGRKIIGVGAPMKSSTLLNYCHINSSLVDYLTEVNVLKINTYSPGVHLKIVDEEEFLKSTDNNENTDALLLSWNMATTLMDKLKENGFKGKFIIPLPKAELVS